MPKTRKIRRIFRGHIKEKDCGSQTDIISNLNPEARNKVCNIIDKLSGIVMSTSIEIGEGQRDNFSDFQALYVKSMSEFTLKKIGIDSLIVNDTDDPLARINKQLQSQIYKYLSLLLGRTYKSNVVELPGVSLFDICNGNGQNLIESINRFKKHSNSQDCELVFKHMSPKSKGSVVNYLDADIIRRFKKSIVLSPDAQSRILDDDELEDTFKVIDFAENNIYDKFGLIDAINIIKKTDFNFSELDDQAINSIQCLLISYETLLSRIIKTFIEQYSNYKNDMNSNNQVTIDLEFLYTLVNDSFKDLFDSLSKQVKSLSKKIEMHIQLIKALESHKQKNEVSEIDDQLKIAYTKLNKLKVDLKELESIKSELKKVYEKINANEASILEIIFEVYRGILQNSVKIKQRNIFLNNIKELLTALGYDNIDDIINTYTAMGMEDGPFTNVNYDYSSTSANDNTSPTASDFIATNKWGKKVVLSGLAGAIIVGAVASPAAASESGQHDTADFASTLLTQEQVIGRVVNTYIYDQGGFVPLDVNGALTRPSDEKPKIKTASVATQNSLDDITSAIGAIVNIATGESEPVKPESEPVKIGKPLPNKPKVGHSQSEGNVTINLQPPKTAKEAVPDTVFVDSLLATQATLKAEKIKANVTEAIVAKSLEQAMQHFKNYFNDTTIQDTNPNSFKTPAPVLKDTAGKINTIFKKIDPSKLDDAQAQTLFSTKLYSMVASLSIYNGHSVKDTIQSLTGTPYEQYKTILDQINNAIVNAPIPVEAKIQLAKQIGWQSKSTTGDNYGVIVDNRPINVDPEYANAQIYVIQEINKLAEAVIATVNPSPEQTPPSNPEQPGSQAPSPEQTPPSNPELVNRANATHIGDSIAVGLSGANTGNNQEIINQLKVGANPAVVLGFIQNIDESLLKDKEVVLSTGILNNTRMINKIPEQLDTLKQRGVVRVLVAGTSKDDLNNQLVAKLIDINNKYPDFIQFMGKFEPAQDGVHPKSYNDYADNKVDFMPVAQPAPDPNTPNPENTPSPEITPQQKALDSLKASNDNYWKHVGLGLEFLINNGYTLEQAQGVMGVLSQESAGTLDPNQKQIGGGPGRGIAQWSVDQRWVYLQEFAKNRNLNHLDYMTQMMFVVHELDTEPGYGKSELLKTKTVHEAVEVFTNKFEKPGEPHMDQRKEHANKIVSKYNELAGVGTAPQPEAPSGQPSGESINNYNLPESGGRTITLQNGNKLDIPQKIGNWYYWSQWDSEWGSKPYTSTGNETQTMRSSACGPSSYSIVASSLLNKAILPIDIANRSVADGFRTADDGTDHRMFGEYAPKDGLQMHNLNKDFNEIKKYIEEGGMVIVNGKDSIDSTPATSGGHFYVIAGVTSDGKFIVLDPNSISKTRTAWDANTILSANQGFIKGFKKA
jgi:hypothetical protein